MRAVIQIREMLPSKKQGTIKFKTYANQTFNCNKEELAPHFAVDERYVIDYATSEFQGSNGPVTMKWVNQARFWKDEDGPNNPPDKEAYRGGGQKYGTGNGQGAPMKQNDTERTHDIHKQVAAKCAMDYFVASGATVTDLEASFPTVADIVLNYIESKPAKSDDGVADAGSEAGAASDPIEDEDFGF